MQTRWMQRAFLLVGMAALACTASHSQTDVALSLYGAFSGTTNGNGTAQSPSNAAGGLLEVRSISKPWLGLEATYSYNRANQTYTDTPSTSTIMTHVANNAHEITGDWIGSLKISNIRPFVLAGGGILFSVPTGESIDVSCVGTCLPILVVNNTSNVVKPVFVYGAGADWGLLPHIGLRFQYRGNLYKAPDLASAIASTNAFTHTSEPMIGAYFRF